MLLARCASSGPATSLKIEIRASKGNLIWNSQHTFKIRQALLFRASSRRPRPYLVNRALGMQSPLKETAHVLEEMGGNPTRRYNSPPDTRKVLCRISRSPGARLGESMAAGSRACRRCGSRPLAESCAVRMVSNEIKLERYAAATERS